MLAVQDRRTKVRLLLDRKEKSVPWLARQLGKHKQTVYNILQGARPQDESFWADVARALEVPVSAVTDDSIEIDPSGALPTSRLTVQPGADPPGPYRDNTPHPKVGRRAFPIRGIAGAAEFPSIEVDSDPEDYEEFSDELYSASVDRFFVRVRGDSMEPTWEHGDLALIHPDPTCSINGIYVAVTHADGALLKVLFVRAGEYYLVPENPNYQPVKLEKGWHMVGYVVGQKRIMGHRKYLEMGDTDGIRPRKTIKELSDRLDEWLSELP
jgi:phage repressor protein C with HTH and peptisase S24 domain